MSYTDSNITIRSISELGNYLDALDENRMISVEFDETDAEYEPEGEDEPFMWGTV